MHGSEALESMESFFQQNPALGRILNDIYDGVYVVDADRRIVFWNRAAEETTGYSAAEVVGRSCYDEVLSHVDEEGTPELPRNGTSQCCLWTWWGLPRSRRSTSPMK